MHAYRICDLTLSSNVPLPELTLVDVASIECHFELMPPGPQLGDFSWFHRWTSADGAPDDENQEPWLCFARKGNGYLLRFPSCGDFFLNEDAKYIHCRPLSGIPHITVRHLLLDQVIPLVLSQRGRIVLHASAVLTPQGVIAFGGRSGLGKSTLAAGLARKESVLVTDDCLVLRRDLSGWTALPSYPGVRLWPATAEKFRSKDVKSKNVAHYTIKRRISDLHIFPFAKGSARLRKFFFLGPDTAEISIKKIPAVRSFVSFISAAYLLDIWDSTSVRRQFETVVQLATELSAYEIRYPREFSLLPEVTKAILDHFEE